MKISSGSQEFLENLRVYLFSSGKSASEIEEIIEELEDHLFEAEKNGKNVEDIIGKTPKQYMEQIASEMPIDKKGLFKYIPMIIIGAFSYVLMGDALRGELKYSLLELVGYTFVILISLFLMSVLFRYVASNKVSSTKEWFMFGIVGITPMALFVGLEFLNRFYDTPTIKFGLIGKLVAIVVSALVFIGLSLWSKTWVSIILMVILFLPEFIIKHSSLQETTKIILSGVIVPVCFGIYALILMMMEKNKGKRVTEQ